MIASKRSLGAAFRARNLAGALVLSIGCSLAPPSAAAQEPKVQISFPASAHRGPLTGRIFLAVSNTDRPELRLQGSRQLFGVDAVRLMPGQAAVIDGRTLGSPLRSLGELPPGNYFVQAFMYRYTDYHRADGHVIWGLDQWEGLAFADAPGNRYSKIQRVALGGSATSTLELSLTEVVPPAPKPHDTEWVKYVKLESKLLSRFWGRPIYLGAIVLLPRGYSSHPELQYPVIYDPRNHYLRDGPFGFGTEPVVETESDRRARENLGVETGYQFYQSWKADRFPRMITVTIVNPTPFYDFSTPMNSVNNGPYGDAIMTELIPYVEEHFRIIRKPYARVVVGKSSGGRDALALQLLHPDFFGGAWIFHPWAFDYRRYFTFDIYRARNAFVVDSGEGGEPGERTFVRTLEGKPDITVRQWVLTEAVMGDDTGVGAEWTGADNALNGPVGDGGYPRPLFDRLTGVIDRDVANYWRAHDLAYYAETNWATIGPRLIGKLHFSIGDSDEWHRDRGVRHFQEILERTDPYYAGSFEYGLGKGHGWQQMTNAKLVEIVADYVAKHSPPGASLAWKSQ